MLDEVYDFLAGTKELSQMETIRQRMILLSCEKQSISDFVINQFVRLLQVLTDESLFNVLLTESMIMSDPNDKLKDA